MLIIIYLNKSCIMLVFVLSIVLGIVQVNELFVYKLMLVEMWGVNIFIFGDVLKNMVKLVVEMFNGCI